MNPIFTAYYEGLLGAFLIGLALGIVLVMLVTQMAERPNLTTEPEDAERHVIGANWH